MEPDETAPSEQLAGRIARLGMGVLGLAAASVGSFFRSVEEGEPRERPAPVDLVALASWTSLWVATQVAQRVVDAAGSAASRITSVADALNKGPLRGRTESVKERLSDLGRRGRVEQEKNEQAAREFLVGAVGQVVNGVLDQIDLNEIVANVDVEAIVERVDLNEIVANVDIGAIVERVDLNEIVAKVDIGAIVERVDLNEIAGDIDLDALAGRMDLNKIAERINVEAILRRLDLAAIAKEVMDELEVNELIRESAGSMTTETVDALRVQGVNADRLVSRIVDRVLRRSAERDLGLPHESVEPNGQDHR
jgi:hypothetical protein